MWICNGPVGFALMLTDLQFFAFVLFTFHFVLTKKIFLQNGSSFSAGKKIASKLPQTPAFKSLLRQAAAHFANASEQVRAPKPSYSLGYTQAGFKVNPLSPSEMA